MAPPHYPVKVGRMLYSLNDPDKGYEVAYNRWYERDHFYGGQMIGPWILAGSRWIATRELKVLRFPNDDTERSPTRGRRVSYLATTGCSRGHEDEHLKWAGEKRARALREQRGFDERTHRTPCFYDYRDTIYRDPTIRVPIELALDHRFDGLVSIARRPCRGGVAKPAFDEWFERPRPPASRSPRVASGDGDPLAARHPPHEGEQHTDAARELRAPARRHRSIQMFFLDTDAREKLGPLPSTTRAASTRRASPRWRSRRRSSPRSSAPTPTPTSSGSTRFDVPA